MYLKKTYYGGRSVEYLSDVIIMLKKKGALYVNDKNDKVPIGQNVEFELKKSRYGSGKCPLNFYIMYGKGIAMIPTMKDVAEQVDTKYKNKKVKLVEMRGSGNGSLYINNQEFKFRGELQLYNLIGKYYEDIMKLMSPKLFSAKIPYSRGTNTWYDKELTQLTGRASIKMSELEDDTDLDEVSVISDDADRLTEDFDDLEEVSVISDDADRLKEEED